ncbi:MAG: aminotransferase class IV [Acidobacteriota bacterium]|nr:aminotransferase class IV [Acidobacteriota bacterium]
MHENVFYDSRIFSAHIALINSFSSASLYGKGVFTTISVRTKKLFLWEKHWSRLLLNALAVKIDLVDFSEETVKNALYQIVEKNKLLNGRARITFFDESSSNLWPFESSRKTSLLITTADCREIPDNFRTGISTFQINSTSPLAGIKSCNYLDKILTLDDAKTRGFYESFCLNERGEITSACMANIFWLKDGNLYTPSLKTGCLPGTTREFVIENIECLEVESGSEALDETDSIFLTSAGIGIVQAAEFNGRKLSRRPHEILALLGPS